MLTALGCTSRFMGSITFELRREIESINGDAAVTSSAYVLAVPSSNYRKSLSLACQLGFATVFSIPDNTIQTACFCVRPHYREITWAKMTENFNSIYSHGFVRVAVCVPHVRVADPEYQRSPHFGPGLQSIGRGGCGCPIPRIGDFLLRDRRPVAAGSPSGRGSGRHQPDC